ncbi:MAG: hypothetical protein MUC73_04210, partial [Cyclobacteriaceae bacterium]|nr:hypothetical protein [Cyclobacteriaceae bacterium]
LYFLVNDTLVGTGDTNLLSRFDSLILLILFSGFMFYIYRTMASSGEAENENSIKIYSMPVSIGLFVLDAGWRRKAGG